MLLRAMMPNNVPIYAVLLLHRRMLKTNFINDTNLYRVASDSSIVQWRRNDDPPSPGCHTSNGSLIMYDALLLNMIKANKANNVSS